MFTNKEVNTLIGLFFAASHSSSADPQQYNQEFNAALNTYFTHYPNDDMIEDTYSLGDSPMDEE